MRRVVADEFQRARIFPGDDLQPAALPDGIGQIAQLAIERIGNGLLANDLEMPKAISAPVVSGAYCRMEPSGN